MLCPNLTTQGQFIGESTKGLAFAFQDYGGEYKNIGANAKPLQICVYRGAIIYDINAAIIALVPLRLLVV
jgi:hypothetical protein